MNKNQLKGSVFGRLLVLQRADAPAHISEKEKRRTYWLCRCSCGTEKIINGASLVGGRSRSCGCLHREIARINQRETARKRRGKPNIATRKHGEACPATPEYISWQSMHARCRDKTHINYGGRGITVCERWASFENFLADMGRRPSRKHSLDRYPDNDGSYRPNNCRWATQKEQNANQRKRARIDQFTDAELLDEVTRRHLGLREAA